MISTQLRLLAATRAKVLALERAIAADLTQELAALPANYGFESAATFVLAVRAATGERRGRKPGATKLGPAIGARLKKRHRAKITDETRADVRKLVAAGKTAPAIAKALGISVPSVANIKKVLGLSRARGSKAK